MGKQYSALDNSHIRFISEQKLFFVGTAADQGRVNISPKGMDSFRIIDDKRALWLNYTGSGNESAAHVQINPRMTVMFCAFDGGPMILRLYGEAKVIHHNDADWNKLIALFPSAAGARQIFDLSIDMAQTSCGFSVPLFDYVEDRTLLQNWTNKKGESGIKDYWLEKNQQSIDGMPTNIKEKNF